MAWNKYPYTNFHEMNLDWFLEQFKQLLAAWDDLQAAWTAYKTDLTGQWEAVETAWQTYKKYIDDYFAKLNVQTEINNKIDSMVASGEFLNVISPTVVLHTTAETSRWLANHITQETGYVIDASLTVAGAAADAKAVGDIINKIDVDIYGPTNDISVTDIPNRLIATNGYLTEANSSYSVYVFPMITGRDYTITASGNEVLRVAMSDTNGSDIRALKNVESSSNISLYKFTNSDGYAYGYIFGKTPNYTNAQFIVIERNTSEGLTTDIAKLQNDIEGFHSEIPLLGNYKEYIDTGSKGFIDGSLSKYDDVFSLKSTQVNTLCNLGDFDANSSIYDSSAVISADSNTFNKGDVIAVDVDVAVSSTTFTQFALGLKTPNSNATKLLFFNFSNSALVDGKIKFSGEFTLNIGDTFSIPFIYVYSTGTSSSNQLTIEGKLSVSKFQKTINTIDQNGITFYLESYQPQTEMMSRGNVKTIGKLHKNGKFIVDVNETPVELRGVGLHALLQYPNLHMRKTFESLRYMGVNLIRVSTYLEDFAFSASDGNIAYGYLSHPTETIAEIEKIIHNCIDLGLYVLLDWHCMDYQSQVVGQKYTGTAILHQTEAEEFFEYFSAKYADCPNILYEFTNEPYNLSPSEMIPYLQSVRSIVVNNVTNPIMIAGQGKPIDESGTLNYSTYLRCKALYNELESNGITDIFTSPHIYGSALPDFQQLYNESIPYFVTEWGNSGSSGDGPGNDQQSINQINWLHSVAVGQSIWKFTDQTMTSSLLVNKGIINSEKYFFGVEDSDLSHNGNLLIRGRYYNFIRGEWIERTPLP